MTNIKYVRCEVIRQDLTICPEEEEGDFRVTFLDMDARKLTGYTFTKETMSKELWGAIDIHKEYIIAVDIDEDNFKLIDIYEKIEV